MAIPKRNLRGLSDIRTHSGSVDRLFLPHKAYLKLATLEMEKERRNMEKKSATHRVNIIDERFREIVTEKESLVRMLDEHNRDSVPVDDCEKKPNISRSKETGFKFKY
ncbi:MAG: hypothetical protein P9X24_17385 [Candidatus Hatepunaea meridiana]|nr:hypothetical protein [Candidatus Hatepunaea meridiana]